ncbi:hypothetical protein [Polaromonas sp. YR568]|uniref:hypothetical protein n=1 Tax=Polaromonas sp. YR568 TaxID=1855301 RepID=UPI00398BDD6F
MNAKTQVRTAAPQHTDNDARELRHRTLMARMDAYQQGTGPAPTVSEFERWREDVAFNLAMGRLLSGGSDS